MLLLCKCGAKSLFAIVFTVAMLIVVILSQYLVLLQLLILGLFSLNNYLYTRTKSAEQSLYLVLNSRNWVHQIKHPFALLYKGYNPSIQL